MRSHDEHIHRILTAIDSGRPVSQRSMARELGVALGLMNLLFRRLIAKGYVKASGMNRNSVRYLLTPAGLSEKSRVSRAYVENTIRLYTETRERIRGSLEALSSNWPMDDGPGEKRIVFYGAGEVAEIGFVSLQGSDLRLVGVLDDRVTRPFFGMPVHRLDRLGAGELAGQPFDRLIIMSIRRSAEMAARLEAAGFPAARVHFLL
ncbi:MAG TPA: hypothetical protein VM364_14380 [Vicinamibacterales bacterium]|nr:hypothetical protein [Vicinamibacterales bacterium]